MREGGADEEVSTDPITDRAQQSDTELPKEGSEGEEICPACLGILQKLCNEQTVEKVIG